MRSLSSSSGIDLMRSTLNSPGGSRANVAASAAVKAGSSIVIYFYLCTTTSSALASVLPALRSTWFWSAG